MQTSEKVDIVIISNHIYVSFLSLSVLTREIQFCFRRALQLLASGLFLPGSMGIIDPCEVGLICLWWEPNIISTYNGCEPYIPKYILKHKFQFFKVDMTVFPLQVIFPTYKGQDSTSGILPTLIFFHFY